MSGPYERPQVGKDCPMARCGDGLAIDLDLVTAAREATQQALAHLDGDEPDLVCAFVCAANPRDIELVNDEVAKACGAATVVGCNAGGVFGDGRSEERR